MRKDDDAGRDPLVTCVIQYDDRPDDVLGPQRELMSINETITKRDGGSYHSNRLSSDSHPPYWQKVVQVKKMLDANACDAVVFLDTDAVMQQPPSAFVARMGASKSFLMSGDMEPWTSEFNAGVWAVRNDSHGRTIIDEWLRKYRPAQWSRIYGKWVCTEDDDASCEWAGSAYEQGSFAPVVEKYGEHINRIDWRQLQHHCTPGSPDFSASETLSCHFASHYKTNIDMYLAARRN